MGRLCPRAGCGLGSGHAAGHQGDEVADNGLGLQPARQMVPGFEASQPAFDTVGGGGDLRMALAVPQLVPTFHDVLQELAHLRGQATWPYAIACHSSSRMGPAATGRSRASLRRTGNKARSRWVRVSGSRFRMCRPMVRCMC